MPGKYLQQTPQEGSTDTVPAMLTPGEFVIRKDAADEIGRDKLHAMNNIDRLSGMSAITSYKPPQFQEGGEVKQPKKLFTKDFVPYDESEEWRAMAHRQERGKGLIGAAGYSAGAGIPAAMLSGALGLSTPTLLAINALAGMAGYSKVGGDKSNLKRVAMGELPYKDVRFKSIDDKMHMSTKKGWKGLSDDVVSQIRANNPQEVLDHYGFQEGGEVMNYFGGGMVRNAGAGYQEGGAIDTLRVFGDKSRSADDLSAMAAMEMMKAQRPSPAEKGHMDFIEEAIRRRKAEREYQGPPIPEYLQPQPASELEIRPPSAPAPEMIPRMQQGGMVPPPMQQQGMVPPPIPQQGLPPAGFMQEGGVVRQPMPTGEPAGMEESPVPQGERTYAEQPMDQLGMEPHEYDSYVENGPERYKYLAPKYKQQTQWTPYDAMVDAGIIDPYEHDKDDFVIMARDQANALREA